MKQSVHTPEKSSRARRRKCGFKVRLCDVPKLKNLQERAASLAAPFGQCVEDCAITDGGGDYSRRRRSGSIT